MIRTTPEQFKNWLEQPEGTNLEFKLARNGITESKELPDYCTALANELGGKLILGVSDKTHEVVGTNAFLGTTNTLSHKLLQTLRIRVEVEEFLYGNKRIVILHVPSRPVSSLIQSTGDYTYPMRSGSSLVEMNSAKIKEILNEVDPDFSTRIVSKFNLEDIDQESVEIFKKLWSSHEKKNNYLSWNTEKVLRSIEVLNDYGINMAGLILFGKKEKIKSILPGAEIIFEWRQEEKIQDDFRKEWRGPFFSIFEDIWSTINARNIRFSFQEGFIQRQIWSFEEKTIREAVLNAVTHRDYSISQASIFIKASPDEFTIESPGGFLSGINEDNIIDRSSWRNRRIAEIFQRAGLVEKAGQGVNTIFENTIRDGKGVPCWKGTDEYFVNLHIPSRVKDEQFVLFLEKVANQKQKLLSFEEIYELEKIREQKKVKDIEFRNKFLELGIIEKIGKTTGMHYILSHQYYQYQDRTGAYTKIAGLSRDKNKELIIEHLRKNKKGARSEDFQEGLDLNQEQINKMLQELKKFGLVKFEGSRRSGKWFLVT